MLSKLRRLDLKFRWIMRATLVFLLVLLIARYSQYTCRGHQEYDSKFEYPLNENFYLIWEKMTRINSTIAPPHFDPQPINPANFSVLLSDTTSCIKSHEQHIRHPELLFLVKTRPTSFAQRAVIRQTWGNPNCTASLGIISRTVFILGFESAASQPNLIEEHYKHKDLLQFDFVDSYYNNTYKVMSALQYVAEHCTQSKFVVLLDDDFLVHTDNLLKVIAQVTAAQYPIYTAGHVFHTPYPYRVPWSKWSISSREYPYKFYPRYASGGTIIFSMPVVRMVAVGLQFVKFLWIDDVLVGIVLQKYGISPMKLKGVHLAYEARVDQLDSMISCHGFSEPQSLQDAWNHLKLFDVCMQ